MKSARIRLVMELVIWTAFMVFPLILFPTLQPFMSEKGVNPPLKGLLITHSLLIAFYYFNFYYAIPKFYFTKRLTAYAGIVFSCLLVLILILQLDRGFNPLPTPPFRFPVIAFIFTIVIRFVMVLLLSLGISTIQRFQHFEKEKLSTELSYLKAQINPHFLFNTLNSIYALSVKKSDSAPEAVTKLASIMRYVITDAASDTVALEKELGYLSSYIELEKLRLTNKVTLHYEILGDPFGKQISPLVFIPLVENAFKHGVSTSESSEIVIVVTILASTLSLKVSNSKVRPDRVSSNGLGIENARRRLNLLYPGKHDLKIEDKENEFLVNLTLVLNA